MIKLLIKLLGLMIMCTGMIGFYFATDLSARLNKSSEMNMFIDSYRGVFIFMKLLTVILIVLGNIVIYLL